MTGARHTIAIIITFKKSNKNLFERRASVCQSSMKQTPSNSRFTQLTFNALNSESNLTRQWISSTVLRTAAVMHLQAFC